MRQVVIALALASVAAASPAQDVLDKQRLEESRKHYRAGEEFLMSEAFDKAEVEFQKATELDPAFVLGFYSLGQSRMAQKKYAPAVEAYTAGRDVIVRQGSLDQRGRAELERRRRDEIQQLEESLVKWRSARIRGGTSEGPQVALEQRIRLLKDQQNRGDHETVRIPAELSLGLGSAHFRLGQHPQAEENYRAAVAVDGKMGAAHNNLAVIYMLSGRLDEAERAMKAAEQAGFTVSSQFKQDLKQRMSTKKP
jgi:tetratricopeptide (TPR) repeat protein